MEVDGLALKILMRAFKDGWKVCNATDEEIAYCKSKGMMFDQEILTHDDFIKRLFRAKNAIDIVDLGRAFVRSFGNKRVDLRSALGSYGVFKCLEPHDAKPTKQMDCLICGGPRPHWDYSPLNYERFKNGGAGLHQYKYFALLDLEMFVATNNSEVPTKDDWSVFAKILSVADGMKANSRIAALANEIKPIVSETKIQIRALLEILGFAGILQPSSMPSFFDRYIGISEPKPRTDSRSDYNYPVDWWAGSDGVNWERVKFWFPEFPDNLVAKTPQKKPVQKRGKKDGIEDDLSRLLTELEKISEEHEELCDTDVREELATAIYCGFIAPEKNYRLPKSFEMFDEDGDAAIRKALSKFLKEACAIADKQGWTKKQRQAAFQDLDVTSEGGLTYDEFFGHAD